MRDRIIQIVVIGLLAIVFANSCNCSVEIRFGSPPRDNPTLTIEAPSLSHQDKEVHFI